MHKPLHLLAISFLSVLFCYGQKIDTLTLFYKPDQHNVSKQDKQRLDSFLFRGWDKISINGYTDETDDEEYNLGLSKKRSGEVYEYIKTKNIPDGIVSSQYFGESMPKADNNSDDGRALNRRTEIIGYQFARITLKPKTDPMTPVTKTLDNGFIITYRPGSMPTSMLANFEAGSAMNFQLISNTMEMRQNNLFNNTTRGEILSSVLIVCGNQLNPCRLDSPVLIKVPIPYKTKCPIEKVKFFNAVAENGKRIWQEQSMQLYPETINGRQYIRIWMDNFCQCINFDFKIDPECFDTDSTQIQYVNANIRNLTAELKGLNSVYMPRKINDSTHSVLFLKDKINEAALSFGLYNGKRRIRSFRDLSLTDFPYDEMNKRFVVSAAKLTLYFPKVKVYEVVLKVNGERYRISPEKNKYEFLYLSRKKQTILVDFSIMEKGKTVQYSNQPVESIPYDETKSFHVIDKKFIKELKQATSVARM